MVKIVILGLGSIGTRHLNNFKKLGCDVVGYDPLSTPFDKFDQVMDCDGIVIATPTSEHFKGIKYVHHMQKPMFVEKPLVKTSEDLDATPLDYIKMVGYNLRFHSCVRWTRDLLGKGLIGRPLWARFTCAQYNDRPVYRRDGVILNWSHEIDLAFHLLGNADVVAASSIGEPELLAELSLVHTNHQCHTTIHLDYLTQPERRGFAIIGQDGSIDVDLVARQGFMKDRDGRVLHSYFGEDSFDSNYLEEAKTFLKVMGGEILEEPFFCTAEEAWDVNNACLIAKDICNE